MNHTQFQNLFDSVCRCFGHTPNAYASKGGPTASGLGLTASTSMGASQQQQQQQQQRGSATPSRMNDEALSEVGKRRTNRLGLQDEQWDELFEKKNASMKTPTSTRPLKTASAANTPPGKRGTSNGNSIAVTDLTTAQALAQAKLAANPPRYNRSKRKRPEKAREEIFRSKDVPAVRPTSTNPTTFTRLLHPSLAMCFATPIRGTDDEPDETRSVDNSDTNTLNTCEDTITSTVYYESKLAHMTETRPPMPLFNQFKVGQQDEIRDIMASDSHSSVNMIRLLQQQKQQQKQGSVVGEDSSSHRKTKATTPRPYSSSSASSRQHTTHRDEEMEDVLPDVKAVSDSSGSDGSVRPPASRRKVFQA